MTATITPPNHIVCPRCLGEQLVDAPRGDTATAWFCDECHGEGHILNPLISEWRTSISPARLIELLGDKADEKRLRMWVVECRKIADITLGESPWPDYKQKCTVESWKNGFYDHYAPPADRCNLIRRLWPNPAIERERVECLECKNGQSGEHVYDQRKGLIVYIDREMHRKVCMTCEGFGDIESPIIDPHWLSSTVLDLAKVIRGTVCERCEGTGKPYGADRTYNPPNKCPVCNGAKFKESPRPELMPVLADALLDAGCDSEEVIEHCQSGGPHVGGCWVIVEILRGQK